MVAQHTVEFAPSRRASPEAQQLGAVSDNEIVDFSVYLKPRAMPPGLSREDFARHRQTSHKGDIAVVEAFARKSGLKVVSVAPERRLIKLQGDAKTVSAAFGTALHHYNGGQGKKFRGRSGVLHLPADVAAITEAVLGIDNRPAASPRFRARARTAHQSESFRPNHVAALYGIPATQTGAGQCIALIELGGGYLDSDTASAFSAMGLSAPHVVSVAVDGGANAPTPDDGADGEVALDIQVAGGVAPGAKIAVYFTPNTDAGFVDAITAATNDVVNKPSVMSISWGSAESNWTAQGLAAMTSALQDAASLNLSLFVAAGDNLATDGVKDGKAHVDFPASSPAAIGCGGTLITVTNGRITSEVVWNEHTSGTGGGISAVYPVPGFQESVTLPPSVNEGHPAGRGVPDVAANADPNSGYIVVVNGQSEVVGGTSAAAPFWAGLTALANQAAGAPAGFFLAKLYTSTGAMRDITSGNNKPKGSHIGYIAGAGWDACTGLGVPIGEKIIALLSAPEGTA